MILEKTCRIQEKDKEATGNMIKEVVVKSMKCFRK
jgi:hypothetical protein